MSFELGEAFVKVRADTDGMAGDAEKGLKGKFGGVGKAIGLSIAAGVAGVIGTAAVGKWALGVNTELEGVRVKAETVFGDSLGTVEKWAAGNAAAMGLTKSEATGLAAGMGDLLIPMGFTRDEAAKMSTETTNLAGALAEWSGGQYEAAEVSEILTKAMLGERDGLKSLGISITEADVSARLAANGTDQLTGAALEQAKAIATQELILEKSTDAQDAYADGSFALARVQSRATALFGEFSEALAVKFLPILEDVASFVGNRVIPKMEGLLETFSNAPTLLSGVIQVFQDLFNVSSDSMGFTETIQSVIGGAIDWLVSPAGIPSIFQFVLDSRQRLFDAAMVLFPAILDAAIAAIPEVLNFITGQAIPGILNLIVTSVPMLLEAALTLFRTLLDAVVEVLPGLLSTVADILPQLAEAILTMIPELLTTAIQLFTSLIDAVMEVLPQLLEVIFGEVLPQLLETILSMIPELLTTGIELFLSLVDAVLEVLPELLTMLLGTVLPELIKTLLSMIPQLLDAAITVFLALVDAVIQVLPQLIGLIIGTVIPQIIMAVLKAVPQLLVAAVKVFTSLLNGLLQLIPKIISGLLGLIPQMVGAILGAVPKMLSAGKDILGGLWDGLKQRWTDAVAWLKGIPGRIKAAIPNPLTILKGIGSSIISGLANGIRDGFGNVRDTLGNLTDRMTSWKGPPERDAVLLKGAGQLIMAGLVDGIVDGTAEVKRTLQDVTGLLESGLAPSMNVGVHATGAAVAGHAAAGAGGGGNTYVIERVELRASDLKEVHDVMDFFDKIKQTARAGRS